MSELKINATFAQKYDKYRQREELQRLKDRYGEPADGSTSESSESTSEDSEVELDPGIERDFYRTLSLLKKKDPKIYEKDVKFYTEDQSVDEAKPSTSRTAVKPMYLKDYERKVILEKEGKYEDDEDSEDDEAARRRERAASPSYVQEQRELKESFRKFVQDSDDEDQDGEGAGTSRLLTRRVKTKEEEAREDADYMSWLRGQAELEGLEHKEDLKHLRDYWNHPELDEKERFLRDYLLNKGYCEEDEDSRIPTYEELVQDHVQDSEEEGETFLERQDDFERSYNFRFEEPDSQLIKTYPRSIATSVRSKDERRKRKREEVKERKRKEKEQKQQQLKQLKNLKRNEIMEKLQKLQELTGNQQLAFSQEDLDGDFDPDHHDQLMQKVFGQDYYGADEEEKPHFEDEDDEEEHWNWDTWTGANGEDDCGPGGEEYSGEPHCEDEDFNMDADFELNRQSSSKKTKKRKKKDDLPQMGKKRKKSHFAEVITKSKPAFDPQEKSFQQYLDEYYNLDYEDIIDDLPCRFRYRTVLPNDFGLSTDEILDADDKELNRWCSLKKTCMFRSEKEELSDLKNFQIKARNDRKKKEILSSIYSQEQQHVEDPQPKKRQELLKNTGDDEEGEEEDQLLVCKKKWKHQEETQIITEQDQSQSRDQRQSRDQNQSWDQSQDQSQSQEQSQDQDQSTKTRRSRKKQKRSGSVGVKIGGRQFSRHRLKAYGLNPKRLYFKHQSRRKNQKNQ